MAINAASTLLQLSPTRPIDLGPPDDGLEVQRLKLMQQQFAETMRANRQQEEMARQREAGDQRRAELAQQVQREKIEADAAAKQEERKRALMDQFAQYRDKGDIEGIEALMPSMQAAGANIDRLGQDDSGLPTYQIDWDAAATEQAEGERLAQAMPYGPDETAVQSLDRMGALGMPMGRGNLDDPRTAAPNTTEDTFGKALAASAHYDETGEAMRQPDAPDIMGAVPKDVVDFGAMQAQAAQRLDPALGALQNAYPERYQGSVGETNAAAAGMALPAPAALEAATKLRQGPDAAMARDFAVEDDLKKKDAEQLKPLSRKDILELEQGGGKKLKEMYDNRGISDTFTRSAGAQAILDILSDDDPNNDMSIAFELPNMLGSRGAQSNKDLAVALGLDAMSTIDKIGEAIVGIIKGGFSGMRKETLMGIVRNKMEKDDDLIYEFLDAADEASKNTRDPDVRYGLDSFMKGNVPKQYRDAWAADRGIADEEEGDDGAQYDPEELPPGVKPGDMSRAGRPRPRGSFEAAAPTGSIDDDAEFQEAFDTATEAEGLNQDAIASLINTESGGDPSVQNRMGSSARGMLQFLNSTARRYGFKDSKEFAALSRTEQLPYIMRYFKDSGITKDSPPEDYALAVAAPGYVGRSDEPDTVIREYRSGTKSGDQARKQNPGWIPADGGEITVGSIIDFYNKHGEAKRSARDLDAAHAREDAEQEELDKIDAELGPEGKPDYEVIQPKKKNARNSKLDSAVLDILR